jgi:hypothetical protein
MLHFVAIHALPMVLSGSPARRALLGTPGRRGASLLDTALRSGDSAVVSVICHALAAETHSSPSRTAFSVNDEVVTTTVPVVKVGESSDDVGRDKWLRHLLVGADGGGRGHGVGMLLHSAIAGVSVASLPPSTDSSDSSPWFSSSSDTSGFVDGHSSGPSFAHSSLPQNRVRVAHTAHGAESHLLYHHHQQHQSQHVGSGSGTQLRDSSGYVNNSSSSRFSAFGSGSNGVAAGGGGVCARAADDDTPHVPSILHEVDTLLSAALRLNTGEESKDLRRLLQRVDGGGYTPLHDAAQSACGEAVPWLCRIAREF